LFPPKPKPYNRFNPQELQTEIEIASWLKRPVRTFKEDHPYYPWLPPTPKVPFPNFNLNFTE